MYSFNDILNATRKGGPNDVQKSAKRINASFTTAMKQIHPPQIQGAPGIAKPNKRTTRSTSTPTKPARQTSYVCAPCDSTGSYSSSCYLSCCFFCAYTPAPCYNFAQPMVTTSPRRSTALTPGVAGCRRALSPVHSPDGDIRLNYGTPTNTKAVISGRTFGNTHTLPTRFST
ncbi:hypothetical protein EJ02DRAFT_461187 [Clathrospora elynae]|uniref:Uncharacterized protein n=1 Tax=Clathrospora elynae TaxID=706981 RepID=A0A6A5T7D9_9PLEO|nr:hypothetical protein EJ02DRAFT_461187 [Clathrospora elynae]